MEYEQLARAVLFVSNAGGDITCRDPEGKAVWVRGLPSGRHDAEKIRHDMAPGDTLDVGEGVVILLPASRIKRAAYGEGATDSGANPAFRPARMTDQELELRKLMRQVSAQSDALERRARAIEEGQKRTSTPAPADVQPVDPAEPAEPAPAEPAKGGDE